MNESVGQSKRQRKPTCSLSAIVGEIGASAVCIAAAYWGLVEALLAFGCWALFSVALWIACRRWRLRQAIRNR
jgi:hypothetical protein